MDYLVPKKSLGQHFLKDDNVARKIVALLERRENDVVLEIGPGDGALTKFLVKEPIDLFCVEIDKRAVDSLKSKFSSPRKARLTVVNKDIQEFDLNSIASTGKVKVVGNIPYNISSQIFFWLFKQRRTVERAILMSQKEVAARLKAQPRTKEYGILTLALQLIGEAKIEFDVSPNCFYPKPKVKSSVFSLNFKGVDISDKEYSQIMKLVKAAFNQRRKKLRNALKRYVFDNYGREVEELNSEARKKGCEFINKRAEELTVNEYLCIFEILKFWENKKKK